MLYIWVYVCIHTYTKKYFSSLSILTPLPKGKNIVDFYSWYKFVKYIQTQN